MPTSVSTDRNKPKPEVPRLCVPFTTIKTDDKGARPKEQTTHKTQTTKEHDQKNRQRTSHKQQRNTTKRTDNAQVTNNKGTRPKEQTTHKSQTTKEHDQKNRQRTRHKQQRNTTKRTDNAQVTNNKGARPKEQTTHKSQTTKEHDQKNRQRTRHKQQRNTTKRTDNAQDTNNKGTRPKEQTTHKSQTTKEHDQKNRQRTSHKQQRNTTKRTDNAQDTNNKGTRPKEQTTHKSQTTKEHDQKNRQRTSHKQQRSTTKRTDNAQDTNNKGTRPKEQTTHKSQTTKEHDQKNRQRTSHKQQRSTTKRTDNAQDTNNKGTRPKEQTTHKSQTTKEHDQKNRQRTSHKQQRSTTKRTDNAQDTNNKGRSKNRSNDDARCITDTEGRITSKQASSDTHLPGWKDEIQCYNCGRFGHFINECRAHKRQYNGNNGRGNRTVRPLHYISRHRRVERSKMNVGADASNMEAGADVDVTLHNQPTVLIDNGATPLKISVYDKEQKLFATMINDYDTSTSKLQIGNTESCKKFVKRDNALLEKTLVEAREHVPIRLLNVSNNVTTIRTGTTVGEGSSNQIRYPNQDIGESASIEFDLEKRYEEEFLSDICPYATSRGKTRLYEAPETKTSKIGIEDTDSEFGIKPRRPCQRRLRQVKQSPL
ncbi:unnamed protein product [Mytilus edulis]|uniref:CCHC-type domain-containing protein n=1 Tax=Mytilus edulis TaxID=6550 RepID=A0A8S3VEE4_MYTED|nr:unnamed protein product [Mytilus edulis]